MKIEVYGDRMLSHKSKDGMDGKDDKDRKPGKRSIEVSFFDIFSPGRTIRQAKNRAQASKGTENPNNQGVAPGGGQDAAAPQAPGPTPNQAPASNPGPTTAAQPQPATPGPVTPVVDNNATTTNEDGILFAPDMSSTADNLASAVETAPGWTTDQDSRLTEMKNDNQSWKNIAAAINNKAISEVRKRWKEIGAGTQQVNNQNEGGKENAEGGNAESKGKEVAVDASSTPDQHSTSYSTSSNVGQGERRIQHIYIVDQDFDVEEIEFLQRLWDKYLDHPDRALAVASRFFDKTGRRITTMQVRDRFEDYHE